MNWGIISNLMQIVAIVFGTYILLRVFKLIGGGRTILYLLVAQSWAVFLKVWVVVCAISKTPLDGLFYGSMWIIQHFLLALGFHRLYVDLKRISSDIGDAGNNGDG